MSGRETWRRCPPDRSRGLLPAHDPATPEPSRLRIAAEWLGLPALFIAAAAIGATWALLMQAPHP